MATAHDNDDITVQLDALLRSTGRILEGFQLSLAGTKIQDAEADMETLIPAAHFKKWKLKFGYRTLPFAVT